MKTALSTSMIVGILGSLVLAGGCVSQKDYDTLAAQNRNMVKQVEGALAALQESNDKYRELKKAADILDAQNKAKDEQIKLLSGGREDLVAKIKELQEALAKASQGPDIGSVVALPPGMDTEIAKLADKYKEIFDYDRARGVLKFKSDMTFDPGEDTIKPEAQKVLQKVAEILNTAEAQKFHAYIAGHTDDMPISRPETKRHHPDNWYLSVHRAVSVEKALSKDGVKPERMGAMGFGEYHPVVPNAAGNKGNVLNRRVEIWIIPPSRFLTVESAKMERAAGLVEK